LIDLRAAVFFIMPLYGILSLALTLLLIFIRHEGSKQCKKKQKKNKLRQAN